MLRLGFIGHLQALAPTLTRFKWMRRDWVCRTLSPDRMSHTADWMRVVISPARRCVELVEITEAILLLTATLLITLPSSPVGL